MTDDEEEDDLDNAMREGCVTDLPDQWFSNSEEASEEAVEDDIDGDDDYENDNTLT